MAMARSNNKGSSPRRDLRISDIYEAEFKCVDKHLAKEKADNTVLDPTAASKSDAVEIATFVVIK